MAFTLKKQTKVTEAAEEVAVEEVVAKKTIIQPVQNNEISKDEIIKALDSLAKLKVEQDRIVAYLTLRMNNKPIDIYVSSDTVSLEFV
jgi:predicted nucleotidyltransferase